jgi:hypothetical protein
MNSIIKRFIGLFRRRGFHFERYNRGEWSSVYIVEKKYFGLGDQKNKVIQKIYSLRQSKESCQDRRSKKRKFIERIAKINLDNMEWGQWTDSQ